MGKRIWSMWWQGEENAPLPVQLSLASIRRNANGAEVIVLDKSTYEQYVTLPEHILEKFNKGLITITHLSEVIRFMLLREYGGLWLDGTIFVTAPIPDEIFSFDLFSLRRNPTKEEAAVIVAGQRWSSYLVGGTKNAPLFNAMFHAYDIYWREHSSVIAYLIIDYLFDVLTEMSKPLHDAAAAIPVYDGDPWDFLHRRDEVGELSDLNGLFQKLDWKMPYKVYSGGGMTLYGKALQDYGIAPEDYMPKDSFSFVEKIRLRLAAVGHLPKKCRDFGMRVVIWRLLDTYLGTASGCIRVYLKRHLFSAVKEHLRETVREALATAESEEDGFSEKEGSHSI